MDIQFSLSSIAAFCNIDPGHYSNPNFRCYVPITCFSLAHFAGRYGITGIRYAGMYHRAIMRNHAGRLEKVAVED